MGKEYLVSGSSFDLPNQSVVLRGKRSQSGPEISLRVPIDLLLSLAMHTRRAVQGHRAMTAEQKTEGWKLVHALPVQAATVHPTDDPTLGQCLLVLDPGTDVELQLSFQSTELVQGVAHALLDAVDSKGSAKPPAQSN